MIEYKFHLVLPDGWDQRLGYKIKTAALKNELMRLREKFPQQSWVIGTRDYMLDGKYGAYKKRMYCIFEVMN